MEKRLRDNIAVYVDKVGVDLATRIAGKIIGSFNIDDFYSCVNDQHVGLVKFHLSVIEYLYCDEKNVDKCCLKESKF